MKRNHFLKKSILKKGRPWRLKTIGRYYFIRSQYHEATDFWQQSLNVYTAINDEVGISNMYNNLGSAQYNTGNNARALEFYLKAVELAEKTGDKLRIATA